MKNKDSKTLPEAAERGEASRLERKAYRQTFWEVLQAYPYRQISATIIYLVVF